MGKKSKKKCCDDEEHPVYSYGARPMPDALWSNTALPRHSPHRALPRDALARRATLACCTAQVLRAALASARRSAW